VDNFPAMTACAIAWLRDDCGGIAGDSPVAVVVVAVAVLIGTDSTDESEGEGAAEAVDARRDSRVRTAESMDCCRPVSFNAARYNSKARSERNNGEVESYRPRQLNPKKKKRSGRNESGLTNAHILSHLEMIIL
jgi:hypothetical protein